MDTERRLIRCASLHNLSLVKLDDLADKDHISKVIKFAMMNQFFF